MTAEVNIPDEAVKLAAEQIRVVAAATCQEAELLANVAGSAEDWIGEAQAALEAAAPLIVAAELDRLADELSLTQQDMREEDNRTIRSSGLGTGIARLRDRAAELRGESR